VLIRQAACCGAARSVSTVHLKPDVLRATAWATVELARLLGVPPLPIRATERDRAGSRAPVYIPLCRRWTDAGKRPDRLRLRVDAPPKTCGQVGRGMENADTWFRRGSASSGPTSGAAHHPDSCRCVTSPWSAEMCCTSRLRLSRGAAGHLPVVPGGRRAISGKGAAGRGLPRPSRVAGRLHIPAALWLITGWSRTRYRPRPRAPRSCQPGIPTDIDPGLFLTSTFSPPRLDPFCTGASAPLFFPGGTGGGWRLLAALNRVFFPASRYALSRTSTALTVCLFRRTGSSLARRADQQSAPLPRWSRSSGQGAGQGVLRSGAVQVPRASSPALRQITAAARLWFRDRCRRRVLGGPGDRAILESMLCGDFFAGPIPLLRVRILHLGGPRAWLWPV